MKFTERPIAFTDLETTGLEEFRNSTQDLRLDYSFFCAKNEISQTELYQIKEFSLSHPFLVAKHEICEIGLVLVSQPDLKIIKTFETKVRINRPWAASPEALKLNGYNAKDWENAIELPEALKQYNSFVKGAIFAAHNVTFDWDFLKTAFLFYDIKLELDRHKLDVFTAAWMTLESKGYKPKSYRLNDIAKTIGISEEPPVHRALNGAMLAYEVYKKLQTLPTNTELPPMSG